MSSKIAKTPKVSPEMSQESKIKAGLIQHLMKEGYDGKFIHDLLKKLKSENVSVKDGLIKLLEENQTQTFNLHNAQTLHHYQAWLEM